MCLSYTVVAICIKIIYCRIVLGTSMDEDCWLGTWMIIQSCIVGDMMMMSSHLYDDRLFRAYVDWCRSSLLMILGPRRSGWLWCFSHMIEWLYIICKRMSWCGHILMIHALIQVAGDICYGADHTVSLLMFIMILFRCLIMYIIRCKGHIKTDDVIMCLYLL